MTAPNRMPVRAPAAPDPETLTRGDAVISGTSSAGPVLVVYCTRNHCGGVYFVEQELWAMYCPMPLAEFLRTLERRRIVVDPDARENWLLAVSTGPEKAN
ncbi:MAG TPA: hypothetical protein VF339_06255 [Gammaproteobacteria bacterium]